MSSSPHLPPYVITGRLHPAVPWVFLAAGPDGRELVIRPLNIANDLIGELRGVHSPALAAVVDVVDEPGGRRWLVTDYVPGTSLDAVLGIGTLPVGAARHLFGLAATGLAALHEAGLVHQDVKPTNLIVTGEGLRLIDYDHVIHAGSRPTCVSGNYAAPEHAAGRPLGPAADVYSLGVVLYEALTGRHPFAGVGEEIVVAHLRDVPPAPAAPRQLPPLPRELVELILACLDKTPTARPSAAAVADALGGRERPTRRWLRALLGVLGVSLLGAGWVQLHHQPAAALPDRGLVHVREPLTPGAGDPR